MSERDRRLKVLVLTSTFPRWQGDTCPMFVADLCRGLAPSMDVTVLAPGSHGAASLEQRDGYTVRRFRYAWPSRIQRLADGAILPNIKRNPLLLAQVPPFVLAQLVAAYRLMRRERFDAIHAHWAVPQGVVASILKRRFGVPVVTTTHGGDIYALNGGVARRAKTWALRTSDHITAVSSALREELITLGIDDERVTVLPMGVDCRRFEPGAEAAPLRLDLNPAGGPVVLFVGRLAEKKGVDVAIEAMRGVLQTHPTARLIIVGDGPQRRSLETVVKHSSLTDSVVFLGARPNVELPHIYRAADLLLAPSVRALDGDQEGVPVVLGEAMASGLPVISTNTGGITDIIVHDETGIIVPERNAHALASAVVALLADPTEMRGMGERARMFVRDRFDHPLIHEAHADLLRRVAA